ncbi:MAG: hypothetical protein A2X94_02440 [Bdellovibrionales bacterium GWB1_55_8]|nr:MAG: hypothetical protein A2X94_02440 [Bdellovibrionales bacterium GWB1_55_8]
MDSTDFTAAKHTIIVSDLHLADAEPPHPGNPLWKRFKRRRHFVDRSFKAFLEHIDKEAGAPVELVFNGDIFDFDSVMKIPRGVQVSWLEQRRGLAAEEPKSRFKFGVILDDHHIWVGALRDFLLKGHRAVFIIGNHDMELYWPSVQQDLLTRLNLPEDKRENVRFCEWFYLSNQDTLIEHGAQYDAYCMASNPIHPLIKKGSKVFVRLPFGNLAGKYMLNGMGLMNPHVDSSFIKGSVREYFVFYYRYIMRTQPLLLWTWFWGAMATLAVSLGDGLLPAMRDPLMTPSRVADIAAKSNATPMMVWSLRELHVHPAIFSPMKILRELWLDRAILLVLIVLVSFQFFSTLNVFVSVSAWWFFIPVGVLLPVFISYAHSVESELDKTQKVSMNMAPLSASIAKVRRVIHGHIHRERHAWFEDVEYLNTGTWSPAFKDPECTLRYGRKCFAWIRTAEDGTRSAQLFEWKDTCVELIEAEARETTQLETVNAVGEA